MLHNVLMTIHGVLQDLENIHLLDLIHIKSMKILAAESLCDLECLVPLPCKSLFDI